MRAVALTALALLGPAATELAAADSVGPADVRRAQCEAKWDRCIENASSWKDAGIGITDRDVYKSCSASYSSCMNAASTSPGPKGKGKTATTPGAVAGSQREPRKSPTRLKSVAAPARVMQRPPSAGVGTPVLKPATTLQVAPARPAGPAAFKIQGR
jgi:hypothetical protein